MQAPDKPKTSPEFAGWLDEIDQAGQLFVPIVALHEISAGVAKLGGKGAKKKASNLDSWLTGLIRDYNDLILGYELSTALTAGYLDGNAQADGHNPGMADVMIAAIAKENDLTVVTENVKHFTLFVPFGVSVITPDEAAAIFKRARGETPPAAPHTRRSRPKS